MDIKEITNTMNEEKVRKEAAIALFNALGPKHIATAEAYRKLGELALEKDTEKYIKEAYEYYKKAYEGYSSFYKNSLCIDNLDFIYTYFLLSDANLDSDNCEQLLDLYFDRIANSIIEDEKLIPDDIHELTLEELRDFVEDNQDSLLEPDQREVFFELFEAFLTYMISNYDKDDTDFVSACETYDHFIPNFDSFEILDTVTCSLVVQHFIKETDFGTALSILDYIFTGECFEDPEEGIQIGNMFFNLVDFLLEATKEDQPDDLVILGEIGKRFKKQFIDAKNVDPDEIYSFLEENFDAEEEFDD